MDERPLCATPHAARLRRACGSSQQHHATAATAPAPAPAPCSSTASTATAMDMQDDPLGLGPPGRGDFDWLVPEAEDGAESRRPAGAQQPVWRPVSPCLCEQKPRPSAARSTAASAAVQCNSSTVMMWRAGLELLNVPDNHTCACTPHFAAGPTGSVWSCWGV